jgi:hypothetical protein
MASFTISAPAASGKMTQYIEDDLLQQGVNSLRCSASFAIGSTIARALARAIVFAALVACVSDAERRQTEHHDVSGIVR